MDLYRIHVSSLRENQLMGWFFSFALSDSRCCVLAQDLKLVIPQSPGAQDNFHMNRKSQNTCPVGVLVKF